MAAGTTFKQCGCRREDGKRLGQRCARLRRRNGTWNPAHGSWYYQLELPPYPGGKRRNPLRRGGFDTQDAAIQEMDQARELLAIAAPGDGDTRVMIADAIQQAIKTTGLLPDPRYVRKTVAVGHHPAARPPTVGEWLAGQWLPAKKIRNGTVRSYEAHIRLYYLPHVGHIRIDRLRVTDIASVFEAIDELNDTVERARASGDPAVRAAVIPVGRRRGARRAGPFPATPGPNRT
jgi:hypothetical protein